MRFSIRLNNDLPLADVVALAQTAEAAGFDQFWISNDLFLRSAPVMLGAVGRATTRIELGIGALAPGMLRLAGELADGVLPFLFPPEHYFGVMPLLEDGMQMCLSTPFYGIVWRRNNLIATEEGL